MTVEELYLENIDEFIKDENKIVTYKWLSLTLQVHCNTAKQMLYKYIDTERNVKGGDGLSVTYFVSGLTKPDENGEQMFKCMVVPEEKLESSKSTLAVMTSCHVYSVQKTKLKDSNALYMTDYAKFKENVFDSNKFSSIKCEWALLRSHDELDLITAAYKTPKENEKKPSVSNGSAVSKPGGKKQQPSAIASMFANKKTADSKKDEKAAVKEEVKTEPKATDKGTSKKNEGLKALFSKQADKNAAAPKETGKKVVTQESRRSPEKKESPVKNESKSKKKRQDESDEDVPMVRNKRRRTNQDLFDSDSGEEEEMEAEPESPIPPTPPREATPEPEAKPDSPEVEEIVEPVPNRSSKEDSSKGSNSGQRKRVKKRKLVDKTYMDDEGFMVTEKVYQEESTDASEAEEPVKEVKKAAPAKSPPKGKKSPKKPSPGKKGSGKQTSLMSFFKKT